MIGAKVLRREDDKLLRGEGCFVDDLPEPAGTVADLKTAQVCVCVSACACRFFFALPCARGAPRTPLPATLTRRAPPLSLSRACPPPPTPKRCAPSTF